MLTVADILARSSDVGAIKIALRLGPPKFYDYIRNFGFGQQTGVDLPGESRGMLRKLENWSAVSIGSISMGQEVGVTPLQLVTAVSSIANGGTLYKPHVVSQLRRGDQILPMTGPLAPSEPKEAIRPETAATLRRLMEGVVLNGTGTRARLDGWTAAGKTGTAQKIDPNTGRYSPTQLIASFSGFAPINEPALTILISLDSPVGQHEGGQVAAPVFKRVAEQVLAYLDVPRDVPLSPKLIQASYKRAEAEEVATLEDFTPVDFGSQPDQPPTAEPVAKSVKGKDLAAEPANPSLTVALDEGGDIALPDFQGKTMRDVTEMCLRLGLEPVLVGSGLATDEAPLVGTKVRRGAKITVRFGDTDAPAKLASKANGIHKNR
jgi:cell division protein FtsI (penicillin-binding protein 3)